MRRAENQNKSATESKKLLECIRAVFSPSQEKELVDHILLMEIRFFGLTTKGVRYLAFQMAERNKIPLNFNQETGLAGKDWLDGFRKRHPKLVLRIPERTAVAHAKAFIRVNVGKFFDLLGDVLEEKMFPPHRTFDCDKTGLSTVQTKSTRLFALTAVVVCMAAGSKYIPPFIIFPRFE